MVGTSRTLRGTWLVNRWPAHKRKMKMKITIRKKIKSKRTRKIRTPSAALAAQPSSIAETPA
jgi:hypothetical protein